MSTDEKRESKDFIRDIVAADVAANRNDGRVVTRFPPEPNGYLHIGHAKSICLNFGIAVEFQGGVCNLRFDDTNPEAEEDEFVRAIQEDIRWLGFDWGDRLFFASDYFQTLYEYAVHLIRKGKAYVCPMGVDAFREYRGTPTSPGKESPDRNRPVAENLDLFERMKNGEFEEGDYVLRARIDMAASNLHLRDPTIYRIKKAHHHRTGDTWCIYPMYDFAHGQGDAIEGVTHSICTLEFESHRPLYDWLVENLPVPSRPYQYEFAKLNLTYIVLSKRRLQRMVAENIVTGWDDPRMPTLSGMRRRGVPPEAIRALCDAVGVTKFDSLTDIALLEYHIRNALNATAERRLAVLNPLKVVIENYPEGDEEEFDAVNNPEDPDAGTRKIRFGRELYVERDDFLEDPPKKFFRLAPGREVRLRYACLVTCTDVIRNEATGEVTELRCTWDPESRGGAAPDGRKVKGTIHWVSAKHAVAVDVRLYDRLFTVENPMADKEADYLEHLNPESLKTIEARVEPSLANAEPGNRFQFERLGYFCVDTRDSQPGKPVFNRTITLRDTWAKVQKKG